MATIQKRVSPTTGKTTYRVQVRLRGFPPQSATFRRLTDARRYVQDTESAIREGRHFKTRVSKTRTVGEMIDRYIDTVLPGRLRNGKGRKQQLRWWRAQLGRYSLANLDAAMIAEQRDLLAQRKQRSGGHLSGATVNRYLAALSHVLNVAAGEWGWLDRSPMANVARKREPASRDRFLSTDEVERLLKACKAGSAPQLHLLVQVALATGMRRGELLGLTWSAVNFKRQRVLLRSTKNGSDRAVPLTPKTLALLKAKQVRTATSSFPAPVLEPRRSPGKPGCRRSPPRGSKTSVFTTCGTQPHRTWR